MNAIFQGRLLYTTGDVPGAVRLFLDLLRGSHESHSRLFLLPSMTDMVDEAAKIPGADKVYLDDFRVAFAVGSYFSDVISFFNHPQHLKSTSGDHPQLKELKLPFTFFLAKQTCVRLARDNEPELSQVWDKREENWRAFWKAQGGKGTLSGSGRASVNGIVVFIVCILFLGPC